MAKLVVLLAILISSLPLAAQTESLLIGPGDVLHVQFYDTPELEQHPRVDDAGDAPLLFLGRLPMRRQRLLRPWQSPKTSCAIPRLR